MRDRRDGDRRGRLILQAISKGYSLRAYRDNDAPALLAVENRAAALFRDHGYPQVADDPLPDAAAVERLVSGARCWVAAAPDGAPAGFAVAVPLAGWLHLKEVSVDPAHGRLGLGRMLVARVVDAAREAELRGVSLTTFRDVPFNAPFYVKLGFADAGTDAPEGLRELLTNELPAGVEASSRVLMLRRT
ncbi:MAG: GNAT family N-acetyltransferase [Rhizobiaceae bacterium]